MVGDTNVFTGTLQVMVAECELLLTPAPTVAALDWKRKRAKHQWYRLKDGSLEDEIERANDADQNWLDANPARQCRSNSARGREDQCPQFAGIKFADCEVFSGRRCRGN